IDREVFARAQAGFPWTAYEDCPHIAQVGEETQVIGQGWVACTAIVGPGGPLGIFFNDTAISHHPLDESRQWRAAILCSILANALWRLKTTDVSPTEQRETPQPEIVRRVARLLTQDPTLSCDALARQLNLSPRGLARSFKKEAKSSIVDYRNELRLASFLERAGAHPGNLLQAALEAGFGSYAQFHRVFRARFGRAPSDYLLEKAPPSSRSTSGSEVSPPDEQAPGH
ncbi:MAG TPA: AraC family transcriptional regulator, partial [Polyangiaceae bacterium]|nr:AraC family transcriptional regulator [Polyangiaceae bacterium]